MTEWGATFLGVNPIQKNSKFIWAYNFQIGTESSEVYLIVGGFLYGCVLVCLYWIYIEKLTTTLIPEDLFVLFVDLVALSFMAGAAAAWPEPKLFVVLAISTMILLMVRFVIASRHEEPIFYRNRYLGGCMNLYPRDKLLRNIASLYSVYFIVVFLFYARSFFNSIGGATFAEIIKKDVSVELYY